jgi:hypothetical protein
LIHEVPALLRDGAFNTVGGKPPSAALAHVHAQPGGNIGKRSMIASAGWYNWTMQHKLKGEEVYYAGAPPKKLLLLHPAVDLSHVASEDQLRSIMRGLVQVRSVVGSPMLCLDSILIQEPRRVFV